MGRRLKASAPAKATSHKASPVEVRNMAHPKIWATAIKLAGGDSHAIRVESYCSVWVTLKA